MRRSYRDTKLQVDLNFVITGNTVTYTLKIYITCIFPFHSPKFPSIPAMLIERNVNALSTMLSDSLCICVCVMEFCDSLGNIVPACWNAPIVSQPVVQACNIHERSRIRTDKSVYAYKRERRRRSLRACPSRNWSSPSSREFETLSGQYVKAFYCRLIDRYKRILLAAKRGNAFAHRDDTLSNKTPARPGVFIHTGRIFAI